MKASALKVRRHRRLVIDRSGFWPNRSKLNRSGKFYRSFGRTEPKQLMHENSLLIATVLHQLFLHYALPMDTEEDAAKSARQFRYLLRAAARVSNFVGSITDDRIDKRTTMPSAVRSSLSKGHQSNSFQYFNALQLTGHGRLGHCQ